MLERIVGKKSEDFSSDQLKELFDKYDKVHIDLGTGDGLFAWRFARENEDTLTLGLDAAREPLSEASGRALKKPARGGAPNAFFFCLNVLEIPADILELLKDKATSLSINFPWGTLLQASAIPFEKNLEEFSSMIKKGGQLDVHINLHVFNDEAQRRSLGLVDLDETFFMETLLPKYEQFGLEYLSHIFVAGGQKVDVASTWGGRLTRRSGRPTLSFHMKKVK